MHRIIFTIFYLSLLAASMSAQTFSGKVVSEKGIPVEAASVILLGSNGRTPVAFARTTADGSFTVKTEKECSSIMISALGYAKDTISTGKFRQGQTVVLHEQALKIKSVTIKAPRVRLEGDTLTYLVNAFRQKQDRTIADVIAKMPGLQVNKDGSIEYQGKPIEKFYIEGMDLLGKNYAQASENVSADKVRSVQVYENHQQIKMLRGKSFSDAAALNIVLSEDAKNVWQLCADIGVGVQLQDGNDMLGDSKAMAMMFGRKMQSISMYKFNNTGSNVTKEVDLSRLFGNGAPEERSVLNNVTAAVPDLDRKRTRFNSSHVIASNWLFKTGGDNDLRFQLNGLLDKSTQRQTTVTTYTDIMNGAVITEDFNAASHRNEASAELMYKVNKDEIYLTNTLRGRLEYNHSDGSATVNGNELKQWVRPHKRYFADEFSMVKKLHGGNTLSISAYLSYNYLPGRLLLTDGETVQRLDAEATYWGASAYFGHRLGKINAKYTLAESGKTQSYKTVNLLTDSRDRYTENRISATPEIYDNTRYVRWSVRLPLSVITRSLNGLTATKLTAEPKLSVNYQPDAHWTAAANYAYSYSPYSGTAVFMTPVFTDYIHLRRGTRSLEVRKTHAATASLQYKHTAAGVFGSMFLTWTCTPDNILYSADVEGNVYSTAASEKRADMNTTSLVGRVSKSFGSHFTLGLTAFYSTTAYSTLITEQVVPSRLRQCNLSFNASWQPAQWFSISEESTLFMTRQKRKAVTGLDEARYRSDLYQHTLQIYVMPGRFQVEWDNDLYHSSNPGVDLKFFSDITVSYKNKITEYSLSLNNIFGNSTYERNVVTANTAVYSRSCLRPREIIARFTLNL